MSRWLLRCWGAPSDRADPEAAELDPAVVPDAIDVSGSAVAALFETAFEPPPHAASANASAITPQDASRLPRALMTSVQIARV